MVKYLAIAAALGFSLLAANSANAWGRHGCASCGGCPGGVCSVPVAPGKYTTYGNAPPGLVATPTATSPAVVTTQPSPAPTYYASTARRGLFGWRR